MLNGNTREFRRLLGFWNVVMMYWVAARVLIINHLGILGVTRVFLHG